MCRGRSGGTPRAQELRPSPIASLPLPCGKQKRGGERFGILDELGRGRGQYRERRRDRSAAIVRVFFEPHETLARNVPEHPSRAAAACRSRRREVLQPPRRSSRAYCLLRPYRSATQTGWARAVAAPLSLWLCRWPLPVIVHGRREAPRSFVSAERLGTREVRLWLRLELRTAPAAARSSWHPNVTDSIGAIRDKFGASARRR